MFLFFPHQVCNCCAGQYNKGEQCEACKYAVGLHRCAAAERETDCLLWRKSSLFGGPLDIQRVLYNLHRKGVPVPVLRQKAEEFIADGLISNEHADHILQTIEQFRGATRIVNADFVGGGGGNVENDGDGAPDRSGVRLSREQLFKELADREEKMQSGAEAGGVTDQFRVYQHIVNQLQSSLPLRLMVQASAGIHTYCAFARSCEPVGLNICVAACVSCVVLPSLTNHLLRNWKIIFTDLGLLVVLAQLKESTPAHISMPGP